MIKYFKLCVSISTLSEDIAENTHFVVHLVAILNFKMDTIYIVISKWYIWPPSPPKYRSKIWNHVSICSEREIRAEIIDFVIHMAAILDLCKLGSVP